MSILTTIFGFLKGPVSRIGDQIVDLRKAKIAAENTSERIILEGQIADLEARKAVVIAEQGWWLTASIRPMFAIPFVIYNAKLIIWDKVLGLGTTDALSSDLLEIEMIVIGAFFIGRSSEKIAKILKR